MKKSALFLTNLLVFSVVLANNPVRQPECPCKNHQLERAKAFYNELARQEIERRKQIKENLEKRKREFERKKGIVAGIAEANRWLVE